MRVVIFGATGMVGAGVLLECLEDERVCSILVVGRQTCGHAHPKLTEALREDFFSYEDLRQHLVGVDACFFCLGTSAAGKSEADYTRLTHDLTLAAATALLLANPGLVFCYVSGMGTDSSEGGRLMWARVKGRTENELMRLPFSAAYLFRPGLIQPLKGVRSRTALYQVFLSGLGWLLPLLRRLFPRHVTDTVTIGRAMIQVVAAGYPRSILEAQDINRLGGAGSRT